MIGSQSLVKSDVSFRLAASKQLAWPLFKDFLSTFLLANFLSRSKIAYAVPGYF